MTIDELRHRLISDHSEIVAILRQLEQRTAGHMLLTGLHASMRAVVLSALREQDEVHSVYLIVCDNQDEAQYLYADLRTLSDEQQDGALLFFPHSHRRRQSSIDESMAIQRTQTLNALVQASRPLTVVTYPEAMSEQVSTPSVLKQSSLILKTDQQISIAQLTNRLLELDFQRVDFVYEPGQFAIRGGIVDIYSYASDDPFRLDFFGDEIDSIRTFDIETQLSDKRVSEIAVVRMSESDEMVSMTAYLPERTLYVGNNIHLTPLQTALQDSDQDWAETIEIGTKCSYDKYTRIAFDTLPQPLFHKQFELLMQDMTEKIDLGYTIYILSDYKKQTDRIAAIMAAIPNQQDDEHMPDEQAERKSLFTPVDKALHDGWIDHAHKIACYTDHQIFERYHRVTLTSDNARRGKALITLKELNQLQVGDYVVHSDHGIGRFGGLVTTGVNGKPQEMIKLIYRDGDTIFVSIHNLHRISKYKGKEGTAPTVSRIGSGAWERLKERTKDKVKEIARDLIRLYATRKQQQGFAYTPDGYMQQELEASFLYEDTPDQLKATQDVKADMEKARPMDRLVCGDVGFGKTEVAVRAAFKAAVDGKQVAVLVPTTVLAYQHFRTFSNRLKDMPVTVDYLTRARTTKDTNRIQKDLAEGKIDIIIGTHRLISKSVKFKDLGLLIIDEEQKFGVSTKEKLRQMKTSVDTLTMSATPIPRTLQFSLVGARDLSVIQTPPPNRYPIQTEIHTFSPEIIAEAVNYEMSRNGQVYFVNNRIADLQHIAEIIQKYVPDARICIGHGQMKPEELEKIILDFSNYDYDILLSTTIVENGIDIPNANTIIINGAHNFGLSDLHQMRGRVGRGNRKAFCYLLAPPLSALNPESRRRLEALENFSDLGSGINIAMQDLDIRGAGNLLGSEQSGFIADLGYETYQKILSQAMAELKNEEPEFAAVEKADAKNAQLSTVGSQLSWVDDCALDSDIEMYFPDQYVPSDSERMLLYRELDNLANSTQLELQLDAYRKRLVDRFGAIPAVSEELILVVPLRVAGKQLGIEKIMLKQQKMFFYFVSRDDSPYFQSEAFGKILQYVSRYPRKCNFREGKGKHSVVISEVPTVASALTICQEIVSI